MGKEQVAAWLGAEDDPLVEDLQYMGDMEQRSVVQDSRYRQDDDFTRKDVRTNNG